MAVFPSFKLTEKGEELLNRSIGEGKTLTFTKFEIGNGDAPSDFRKQTGLVNKFYEFPILNTSIQKDQVLRIKGYFDNKSFSEDKQLKEIGVYVRLEGIDIDYLYSYTNAGDTGDIIPASSRGFYSRTLDVANYIGYATNITFNIEQLRDRYAFNTENEMKVASYLKTGDKVELWGNLVLGDKPTDEYIIQESGDIQLSNGLFAKKVSFKYIAQTIEEMQGTALKVGDIIEVLGYYTAGDGAGHKRVIASEDDGSGIQLSNGLWANIVHRGIIHSNWFGANKNGDVTDIFKKIVAYNKPTVIDYGTYTITDYIFVKNNKIIEDNGDYTDKYIVYSKELKKELPARKLIGTYNFSEFGDKVIGGFQANEINKNTGEYILSFSDSFNETKTSTIIILDKNFNFVRKKEQPLGHCNGLAYNPKTNKLIVSGFLGSDKNIYILNYDTLEIERTINVGYYNVSVTYDEKNDMYMITNFTDVKFYNQDFELQFSTTIDAMVDYDSKGMVFQNACYYRGNILIYGNASPYFSTTKLYVWSLDNKLKNVYEFETLEYSDEAEGLTAINNNKLLISDYQYSQKIIKFYEVDFEKVGVNRIEVNTTLDKSVYVDSEALENGDGTTEKPFKTIKECLLRCRDINNLTIVLKNKPLDRTVSIYNSANILIKSVDSEKVEFDTEVNLYGCSRITFLNVKFTKNNSNQLYIQDSNIIFSTCEFIFNNTLSDYQMKLYRSAITFLSCNFDNHNYIAYIVEACNIQFSNCTSTNCKNRFYIYNSIVYVKGGTYISENDSIIDGLIFPNRTATTSLNTPYYTYKMEQEGVLADYYSYMDEQTAYQKQLEEEEQAKYEAYNLALQENLELTWEEFETQYSPTMSLEEKLKKPVIPESVQKFMKKYL